MYTAYCPELDVASCGSDVEQARKNLLEVIEIQLEETAKLGTLKAFLFVPRICCHSPIDISNSKPFQSSQLD